MYKILWFITVVTVQNQRMCVNVYLIFVAVPVVRVETRIAYACLNESV